MTYPKYVATFFDSGRQLPSQILTKIISWFKWRIFPKIFLNLEIFWTSSKLTAQIIKGCSKFWIFHTFKYCLNCSTNSIFKKQWADNVLSFFFISDNIHDLTQNITMGSNLLRTWIKLFLYTYFFTGFLVGFCTITCR